MKTFSELREARKKKMPPGEHVFDTKVKGVGIMVHKEKGKFLIYGVFHTCTVQNLLT